MVSDSRKKFKFLLILLGISISLFTISCSEKDKPSGDRQRDNQVRGPILDPDFNKKGPLKAIGEIPENPKTLAKLGDKYFESGRYEKAVEVYEKILKLDPNDLDAYNDIGLALNQIGKSDIAVKMLKKGTEVNPSYQRIWLSLGFVLTSAGTKEEAKTAFKKALDLDPDSIVGQEAKRILGSLN